MKIVSNFVNGICLLKKYINEETEIEIDSQELRVTVFDIDQISDNDFEKLIKYGWIIHNNYVSFYDLEWTINN